MPVHPSSGDNICLDTQRPEWKYVDISRLEGRCHCICRPDDIWLDTLRPEDTRYI